MEELQATPGQPDTLPCPRLPMLSATNQGLVADYLAYLSARQYAPSVQEGTLRALKSFAVLMPPTRQALLYADLTQTTPADIDAWIEVSAQRKLAPGTIATRLRVVQGFFGFLCDRGLSAPVPHSFPTPSHSGARRTCPAPWPKTRSSPSFGSSMRCATVPCFC